MSPRPNRRLVCVAPGEIEWRESQGAAPSPCQMRVQNHFGTEKHGTMMAFVHGHANQRGRWDDEARLHRSGEGLLWDYPIALGNMQVGQVVELGAEVEGEWLGRRVFFSGPFERESLVRPDQCRLLSPNVPWKSGMLLDPAEFALGGLRDGNVRIGDQIAIFGMGAIGLVATQLARAAGCSKVIALDPLENRREAALRCGADEALDPTTCDAGLAVRELTSMRGFDVALEFSGSSAALQAALRGVAYLGTVVCGAFPAPYPPGLDFGAEAHMNRPRIVFSRACSDPSPDHPRWDWSRIRQTCLELVENATLDGEPIVGPLVPFESLLEAYPGIAADPAHMIKLVVSYL